MSRSIVLEYTTAPLYEARKLRTCTFCRYSFSGVEPLSRHLVSCHHYCLNCSRQFSSLDSVASHLSESLRHNHCFDCGRDFVNPNTLHSHLRSSLHHPKDVQCPYCNSSFVSASALTKHLESGKCVQFGLDQITEGIRNWELRTGNSYLLTKPRIGWHSDADNPPVRTKYIATERSFDGQFYVCCICHKKFHMLRSLNQHLSSNPHHPKEFHCRKCGTEFRFISALFEHVESEACGAMKESELKKVALDAQQFVTSSNSITYYYSDSYSD